MIPAIMGNEVQFMFINMASSLAEHPRRPDQAARHHLADAAPRAAERPDRRAKRAIPATGTNAWNGLFAPAGIPKPLLNRIHADVVKVMESPAMKDVARQGVHVQSWSTNLRRNSSSSCSRKSRPGARWSSTTTSRSNEGRVPHPSSTSNHEKDFPAQLRSASSRRTSRSRCATARASRPTSSARKAGGRFPAIINIGGYQQGQAVGAARGPRGKSQSAT